MSTWRTTYLSALAIGASLPLQAKQIESFEASKLPSWLLASNKSALQLSSYDAQHGKQSLLWDTAKSPKLKLNPKPFLKDAKAKPLQLRMWVYSESPGGKMSITGQGAGANVKQVIDYQLNFRGWRSLWVHFGEDGQVIRDGESMAPDSETVIDFSAITLEVHAAKPPKLLIDNFELTTGAIPHGRLGSAQSPYIVNDPSNRHNYPWTAKAYQFDPEKFDTAALDLQQLEVIENRVGQFIAGAKFANRGKAKRGYEAAEKVIKIDGKRVAQGPGVYSHIVERYYNQNGAPGIHTRDINGALLYCADKFIETNDEAWKTKYLAYLDYRHRKGHAADSATMNLVFEAKNAANYVGSLILMKPFLDEQRLKREADNIKWICGFNHLYSENPQPVDADKILGDMQTLLISLYLEPAQSEADKIKKLCGYIQFGKLIDLTMVPGISNAKRPHIVKPDFGIWHHGMEMTFSYGYAAAQRYCVYYHVLHGTAAQLDASVAEGIIQYYHGLFTQQGNASYMGSRGLGFGHISGYTDMLAHTASAGLTPAQEILSQYANAGTIQLSQIPTHLQEGLKPQFTNRSGQLSAVGGTKVLPYAATIAHHSGTQLAAIRGINRSVASPEIFLKPVNAANVFGQQQGQGFLQLIPNEGIRTSAIDMKAGAWDWSHYPGATTVKVDNNFYRKELKHGKIRMDRETLSGALAHFGANGLFYQELVASPKHALSSLEGHKSWFFFGDNIVCLGSGISTQGTNKPLVTTLFQDNRAAKKLPQALSLETQGATEELTQQEYSKSMTAPLAVTDHDGHHYLMLSQQDIQLQRGQIQSIDSTGKKKTQGSSSLAWIDHGTDPSNASYAYAIQLANGADKHSSNDYAIVQQDAKAHIVTHLPSQSTGYAVLAGNATWESGFLRASQSPILAMVSHVNAESAQLTLCDPKLKMQPLTSKLSQEQIDAIDPDNRHLPHQVTVAGIWQDANVTPPTDIKLVPDATNNTTSIQLSCIDGHSYDISLSGGSKTVAVNDSSAPALSSHPKFMWILAAGGILIIMLALIKKVRG